MLVSGAGTNLRALADASTGDAPYRVVLVLSNRPGAAGLRIAAERGIAHEAHPVSQHGGDSAARDRVLVDRLRAAGVELVVCAGYDRVLSDEFLAAFPDAILNIHPSLMPAFAGGMRAVEDALASGVKVSGCTVHLLERGAPDGGAIVAQACVPVEEGDDAGSLRQRIHEQEWRLLPQAVRLWCQGRLRRVDGRVRVLPADEARAAAAEVREPDLRPVPVAVRMPEGYGIRASTSPPALPWSRAEERLRTARSYWVVSAGRRPHAMPVWGLWLDGAVWFSTDPDSTKGRRIAADPHLSVHLESADDLVVVNGHAELVTAREALTRFADAYSDKYAYRPDPDTSTVYRVRPRTALTWLESDFPTTALRWEFSP